MDDVGKEVLAAQAALAETSAPGAEAELSAMNDTLTAALEVTELIKFVVYISDCLLYYDKHCLLTEVLAPKTTIFAMVLRKDMNRKETLNCSTKSDNALTRIWTRA